MSNRAPLLLDEAPIIVYPALAAALGINEAIIFQQLHFLLNSTRQAKSHYNYVDGRWWVYNSYPEWRQHFPWLSEITIKRLFLELEEWQLVISRQSMKNKSDRRKWYTIDYALWADYVETIVSKRYDEPSYQNDPIIVSKRDDGYTETPAEIKDSLRGQKPAQVRPARERQRNPYFDAIVQAFAWDPEHITRSQKTLIGSVAASLKAAGYTVEQVQLIYDYCKKQDWKTFGPKALEAHAGNALRAAGGSSGSGGQRPGVTVTPAPQMSEAERAELAARLDATRKKLELGS